MLKTMQYGGWQYNENPSEITQEVQEVFNKAVKSLGVGQTRELMLWLGTQLVNGHNYAFVVRTESATLKPTVSYELLICNVSFDKQIYSIYSLEKIITSSSSPVGGIIGSSVAEAKIQTSDCIVADEMKKLFNKAFEKMVGVVYTPELYIAHQVVHGNNYYFIAKAQIMNQEMTTDYKVIIINASEAGVVAKNFFHLL